MVRPSGDAKYLLLAGLGFGFALGGSALVVPLLALQSGFSPSAVGFLTALSAAVQLLSRLMLPWLLGLVSDRYIVVPACLLLLFSAGILALTATLWAFVAAMTLQGCARSFFWTASQTHAARGPGSAVRRLAQLAAASSVGSLAGPALSGAVAAAFSLQVALALAVAMAAMAAVASCFLDGLQPYRREARATRPSMWRARGVMLGCWTSFAAGGWRGMLDSYVPVVLAVAGLGAASIGLLTAASEAASLAANGWLSRYEVRGLDHLAESAGFAILGGAVALPLVAHSVALSAIALAVAGAGAGIATVLGPNAVSLYAEPSEQGAAIALAGTYRAGARLFAPGVVGAASLVASVPLAMATVGAATALPLLILSHLRLAPDAE